MLNTGNSMHRLTNATHLARASDPAPAQMAAMMTIGRAAGKDSQEEIVVIPVSVVPNT
jgi:hypothetical protein